MFARVPASSANLGPGFDTLAIALSLHVEVTLELADSLHVSSEGCGAGLFDDERHLGVQVAAKVLGHHNFSLRVSSSIPLSRGLGSSAALAAAAAAAAGAADPLRIAVEVDGHPENAAASVWGGLVTARVNDAGDVVARALTLDEAWRFVVVVPDEELSTARAREVLPATVSLRDAVKNLNALGLLIAGLADQNAMDESAMDDVLHQPYRAPLLPFASGVLGLLREAGAVTSCWSGAGSSMLGLVTEETAEKVARAARDYLHDHSIPGVVHVLDADRTGLVVR